MFPHPHDGRAAVTDGATHAMMTAYSRGSVVAAASVALVVALATSLVAVRVALAAPATSMGVATREASAPGTVCGGGAAAYNKTVCDPASSTCCAYKWSPNGFGCCTMPNAVCCSNGYTCCPAGHTCKDTGGSWSVVTECVPNTEPDAAAPDALSVMGQQICKIGVGEPFDSTRKSVVIIGDSVSIGYTPSVATALADVAGVQHSPWSGDGGACETAYGAQCLDIFMSSSSGVPLKPDVVYFNWGLHNMVTSGPGVPGQSGNTSVYLSQLTDITERLQAKQAAHGGKLIFGITSAYLCTAAQDDIVQQLNSQAEGLMKAKGIPTVNLHDAIVNKCGAAPVAECFGLKGCWCPHCPPGYAWLANSTVAPAIRALL